MLAGPPPAPAPSPASSAAVSASPAPSATTAPFESNMPAASDLALQWLRALAGGNLDRSQLTADFNAFMTPDRVAYAAKALSALGEPVSAKLLRSYERGGLIVDTLRITYPDRIVTSLLYRRPDGKIAELFIFPAGS